MSKRIKNILVAYIIISFIIFLGTRFWPNTMNPHDTDVMKYFENLWGFVGIGEAEEVTVITLIIGDNVYERIVDKNNLPQEINSFNINRILWDVFVMNKYEKA